MNKNENKNSELIVNLSSENLVANPKDSLKNMEFELDISSRNLIQLPENTSERLIYLNACNNPQLQLNTLQNLHFLRTLALDFCNITSFKHIPYFPQLMHLSLIGNEIKSFKHMKIYKDLRSLDIRGNPISFDAVKLINAIGSIHIERINNNKITQEEFENAFRLSPLIGLAIRKGKNPKDKCADDEVQQSISYITQNQNAQNAPSTLQIMDNMGSKIVIIPCEVVHAKWYAFDCHLTESGDYSEWVDLECYTRTLPVTPGIEKRLIKCEYDIEVPGKNSILSGTAYTEQPINWNNEKTLISTKYYTPSLVGKTSEGSLVILSLENTQNNPQPNTNTSGPPSLNTNSNINTTNINTMLFSMENLMQNRVSNTLVKWLIDGKEVKQKSSFFDIPENSAGKTLKVEVYPVSDSFPSTVFSPFSYETKITEADPEIEEFTITENPIVGEPIDITARFFPQSSHVPVTLEAANSLTDKFVKIAELEKVNPFSYIYTPSKELSNCYIRATCVIGDRLYSVYSKTPVKLITIPTLEAKICGSFLVNHELVVLFENNEVPRDISWLLDITEGEVDDLYEETKTYKDLNCHTPIFKPTDECIGHKVCVRIVPHSTDVIYAESTVESEKPIEPDHYDIHPENIFAANTNYKPTEDVKIDMGEDGHWQISNYSSPKGWKDIFYGQSYTPSFTEIGSYLRFVSPTTDKFLGMIQQNTSLIKSLIIESNGYNVGSLLSIDIDFYDRYDIELSGGVPYFNIFWIRCSRGGSDDIIVQEGGYEYVVSFEDLGSKIKARIQLETNGETKDSNPTPMIKQGMFKQSIILGDPIVSHTLSLSTDKGKIKWFREKTEVGQKNTYEKLDTNQRELLLLFSDVRRKIRVQIETKKSSFFETIGPILPINVYIGQLLSTERIFRPSKTRTLFKWLNENNEIISTDDQYTPTQEEANSFIKVVNYSPEQQNQEEDGESESESESDGINLMDDSETCEIGPLLIRKEGIEVEKLSDGSLKITGECLDDGSGQFFWRIWQDGYSNDIDNGNSQTLILLPAMIGCEIDGGWRQSEDSEIKWSKNRVYVDRALPQPEATLLEEGPLVVGCTLTCNAKKLPKLDLCYEWKRWDGSKFIMINTKRGNKVNQKKNVAKLDKQYVVSTEDCDCYVCCDVRHIDPADGFKGPPFTVRTSGVIPPAKYLTIKGKPIVGSRLSAYSNDKFSDRCRIEWQKCMDDSWISLSKQNQYIVKEEDVGYVIRVIGVLGKEQRYSAEFGPIEGPDEYSGTNTTTTTTTGTNSTTQGLDTDILNGVVPEGSNIDFDIPSDFNTVDVDNNDNNNNEEEAQNEEEQHNEEEKPKKPEFGEEFKFKGKDQLGSNWVVTMTKSGLTVKSKTTKRVATWAKGNIIPTNSSGRKVDVIAGVFRVTILPSNPTQTMDLKGFRKLILEAVRFYKTNKK